MTDLVLLTIKAGDGGDGRVSFLRAKYQPKGGPDGGDGGNGGDVVVRASAHLTTLSHLAGKKAVTATPGSPGSSRSKHGPNGSPTVFEVPEGTYLWQVAENETAARRRELAAMTERISRDQVRFEQFAYEYVGAPPPAPNPPDQIETSFDQHIIKQHGFHPETQGLELLGILEKDGQELLLAQGGFGGKGNEHFKAATERTPLRAERGTPGEERLVILELRLLADIGLVGLPNAGKSTLLSVITKARPKIANYPFTTLEPHLGVANLPDGREVVVADIPGLIEGASQGKGLGHDFLRHVDHCESLLFVLFIEDSALAQVHDDPQLGARLLWEQYQLLAKELAGYSPQLAAKRRLISCNKSDLYSEALREEAADLFERRGFQLHFFSAGTKAGVSELLAKLAPPESSS